jgi:ABC-2 type transport system ATP-binding protein
VSATIDPNVTIEVDHASKWFRDLVAMSDVSFGVGPGVTALLGPNGAGKSTLLRVLCGLTSPSQGRVRILGRNPRADVGIRRHIGLVPQQETLFERMTGLEFVTLGARLHRVPKPMTSAAAALHTVELDPGDDRPIRAYSKGMRQRAKVAHAIVHDPSVVVLDEPLEGLDPRQRLRMIQLFRELGDSGRTVLVSSHVLDEVERFGSRVLVMAQGRLVAEGDFHAIRDLMDDRPHRLRVRTDRPRQLAGGLLNRRAAVGTYLEDEASLIVDTVDVATFRHTVAAVAKDEGARLIEVNPLDDDLDSVFRYLVNRR